MKKRVSCHRGAHKWVDRVQVNQCPDRVTNAFGNGPPLEEWVFNITECKYCGKNKNRNS